ncbi:histidine phosphatase family protein [Streptomyces sp. XD-27]|uniref:histidine phosphatase family protein n=1 Tax=Streptomyces sp. XD-27 TaxID=3062779 RepID=UPI0026F44405|nr:histidine phosphatase family protein [Streptomyces sp. XD-27]WKX71645.1 histidine phosphatase family protein [Streptomyces sp. XD-27]
MAHRLLYLVRHGEYVSDRDDPLDEGTLTENGRRQSRLVAERLRQVPFTAVHHSTERRAAQTAALITAELPGVPVHPSDLLRECIPAIPEPEAVTPAQTAFFDGLPPESLDEGPRQAAAALRRYAGPVTDDGEGDGDRSAGPELVVSHGNLINWFVCHALGGPASGWLRLLDYHCAVTVILYRSDGPAKLVTYNDASHLPPELRGTDYPVDWRI